MKIKAIFFDLGGVIIRTEYQTPRQRLAERLGMEYEDLVGLVFDSPTAQKATLGKTTAAEHWAAVMKRLKRPVSEAQAIRAEFFAGDFVDRALVDFLRSLRGRYKTGLISNAFDDLRPFIVREKFDDAFDHIIISAEVGAAKPDPQIYHIALEQAQVEPKEAVFVDDFFENVEACEKVGMKGIHFKDPESALNQLKKMI